MNNDREAERLISPAQLQDWLGCGRTKTYELLQRGEIRSYRIGRLVRKSLDGRLISST